LDPLHARRVPLCVRSFRETTPWVGNLLRLDAIVAFTVVVPLAVGAAAKTKLGEHFLLDFALLPQLDLILELIELVDQYRRCARRQLVLPRRAHGARISVVESDSSKSAVERYRAPESGAIVAMRLPGPSSRARARDRKSVV